VRLIIVAMLALLCRAASLAQGQPATTTPEWTLPTLMAGMHQVRSSTAQFVELRYFRLLNQPQQSSGTLLYVAPNYLQKTTTEPAPSRLTISGDQLTIEQQRQPTRTIALHDYSEIGMLVDSIKAILAGDLAVLTRSFTATLAGGPDAWTLTLEPRDAKLRDLVASIRIQGRRDTIRDVLTLHADGGRTDMTVTPEAK
jgi:hypothetical protein